LKLNGDWLGLHATAASPFDEVSAGIGCCCYCCCCSRCECASIICMEELCCRFRDQWVGVAEREKVGVGYLAPVYVCLRCACLAPQCKLILDELLVSAFAVPCPCMHVSVTWFVLSGA
jgi:hypothetical protein